MSSANSETTTLINRVDTLVKGVNKAAPGAAGRMIVDLENTLGKIEQRMHTAWTYCGQHKENEEAFKRFKEMLGAYELGHSALSEYRIK